MTQHTDLQSTIAARERDYEQLLSAKSAVDQQLTAVIQQSAEKDNIISQISEDKNNLGKIYK